MTAPTQYRVEYIGHDSYIFVPIEQKTNEEVKKSAENVTNVTKKQFENNLNKS